MGLSVYLVFFVTSCFFACTEAGVEFYCPDSYDYTRHDLHGNGIKVDTVTSFIFETKGNNNAYILLQNNRDQYTSNIVEIVLGGGSNGISAIRTAQQGTNLATYSGAVINSNSYTRLWISWGGGCIQVGQGVIRGSSVIMNWCGLSYTISGLRISFGHGSDGYFNFPRADTCVQVMKNSGGTAQSGKYTLANGSGQLYTVYCLYQGTFGYAYISPDTSVEPNLSALVTDKSEVLIRHRRLDGTQYFATAAQINRYSTIPLGVYYNSNPGYKRPVNYLLAPYLYLGFIPVAAVGNHLGDTQGWKVQGTDHTFTNCDGNPNSYFAVMFNHNNRPYDSYSHGKTDLLHVWYDFAGETLNKANYLPTDIFASQFEIHFGGCGGYQTSTSFPDVAGVALGFKFVLDSSCSTPGNIASGSLKYSGLTPGSTLLYACNTGFTRTIGDTNRTCSSSGFWSGTEPTCSDINECASNPCQNGAVCVNGLNQYSCQCAAGWQGTNCDQDVNECASNPCANGATCHNNQNQYSCTCASGWQGYNCDQDIDECASKPCQNGATCNNLLNRYTCTCTGGWTGTNCDQDVNECASNPCKNGATCNNLLNQYTCDCAGGWQGYNCDRDIDECASNPCFNGATCNNLANQYTCTCASGWQGYTCNEDINECASNPCQNGAVCVNGRNQYSCQCAAGWQGTNCDQDVNECASNPCANGATCHNNQNQYSCTCAAGWQGFNCDQDIDECASNPCQKGATCNDLVNGYTCTCTGGWSGTNCDLDVDECASNPCKNGATCNNLLNQYTCDCAGGWQGYNCDTDINECASNPCFNGATCNNFVNQYTCTCAGGWQGYNCDEDIDECLSNPCMNGATCLNNQNSYTCTCTGGWQGTDCDIDINECASNPCNNGATCNNLLDHYTCTCAGGWRGYDCDQDIDECSSNPCQNGATCNNLLNQYTCDCAGGWQGYDCDTDIDECASNPCQNGATCNNLLNQYTCDCAGGWQGNDCDTDIDECASNPCQNGATCNNLFDNYTCDCAGGWQGYDCDTDIDECQSSPCVNGTCSNLQNEYSCTCFQWYTGKDCDYLMGSPINGNWGAWAAWHGCSATCGTGIKRRYRSCDDPSPDYGGKTCAGSSFEEVSCSGGSACPAVVDGNWGAWSSATTCSVTCGQGRTTRSRQCDSPAPSNGGKVCTGDNMLVETCQLQTCNTTVNTVVNGHTVGSAYVNVCPSGYFKCNSGRITCIEEDFVCDCMADCQDGSDENQIWAGCPQFCNNATDLKNTYMAFLLLFWILVNVYRHLL